LVLLIGLFWPLAARATEEASFQPADQAAALAARIAGDEVRTRIVIDLAGEVAPSVYMLPEPNRLILDLPGLSFEPMDDAEVEPRGLISAFRYGPFAPGRGRIVVDLSDYVVIDEILMLAALDDQPARLVLDLVRSDQDGFMAEVERTRESFLASVEAPKKTGSILPTPAAARSSWLIPAMAVSILAPSAGLASWRKRSSSALRASSSPICAPRVALRST
jgi:hypothetical protein